MALIRNRTHLAETLRTLRKAAGLNQRDMADQLGLDRSAYAYYETGSSSPTLENLKKLADIFGVTTDQLLGRKLTTPAESLTVCDSATDGVEPTRALALLPADERSLLMWYRQLSEEEKAEWIKKLSYHCLNRD